jgi:hypothetical protein
MLYVYVSDCNGRYTERYGGNVDSEVEINDVDNMQKAWVQTEVWVLGNWILRLTEGSWDYDDNADGDDNNNNNNNNHRN